MKTMQSPKSILLLVLLLALTACGGNEDEDAPKPTQSAEVLYNNARDKLEAKEYKDAISDFDEVERQHPYSEWATRGEIMSAYAAYKSGDYDKAVPALERFAKLHPSDTSTAYAYYLIALCYYEQITDVGRDQVMTEKALRALTEVVKRFPGSEYARDAKLKLDLTYDHLAGKEMEIGRYYLVRDEYLAAINRFRNVVENYQTTSHVPEALHRLVEAYLKLGVPDEAKRYAAVLGYNFPASAWYQDSYLLLDENGLKPATEQESRIEKLLPSSLIKF